MTDRTATPRPDSDSTVGKPSTSRTAIVERFRRYDDDNNTTLVFEKSDDLVLAVRAIEDHVTVDLAESQVLIRHNVDDEGITIVYVDVARGQTDSGSVLAGVIPALQSVQEALAGFEGGAQ